MMHNNNAGVILRMDSYSVEISPSVLGRAKELQIASAQQDRQQHTQPQTKQPNRGRRSTNRAHPALFTRGVSRIEQQPSRVAALQQQKSKGSSSSVDQVSGKQRKQG